MYPWGTGGDGVGWALNHKCILYDYNWKVNSEAK